ncbi:hypothetical protein HMPREF3207_00501 [Citrobacter koseri]|nr:hypothetical protein HMPREF3207_00501 [Citrobacter koseri]
MNKNILSNILTASQNYPKRSLFVPQVACNIQNFTNCLIMFHLC